MDKNIICIIEDSEGYRDALVCYMRSYCANYVIHIVESDSIDTDETRDLVSKCHVILVNTKFMESMNNLNKNLVEKIVFLSDDLLKEDLDKFKEFRLISKYSDVSEMINYIDSMSFNHLPVKTYGHATDSKLIVCCGLSGGAGTTTIASGVASYLSKYKGRRVFYISFDLYESEFHDGSGKFHEKIMYSFIKNNYRNTEHVIEDNIVETIDGVWRLPPSRHQNPVRELCYEEREKYLNEILNNKGFDYVVVDASNIQDEFTQYLISNSDNTLLIDRHKSNKHRYIKELQQYIVNNQGDNGKFMLIENFVPDKGNQNYEQAISIKFHENIEYIQEMKIITDYIG